VAFRIRQFNHVIIKGIGDFIVVKTSWQGNNTTRSRCGNCWAYIPEVVTDIVRSFIVRSFIVSVHIIVRIRQLNQFNLWIIVGWSFSGFTFRDARYSLSGFELGGKGVMKPSDIASNVDPISYGIPHAISAGRVLTTVTCMVTNAGTKKMLYKGEIEGFGEAWYDPDQVANIFGFAKLEDQYRITYDSSVERAF
jgi:hypothetical protein